MARTSEDPRRTMVCVRLTDGEIKALDALCSARRWTRSEALRAILSAGVTKLLREVAKERG
jgi:hypothetical protein